MAESYQQRPSAVLGIEDDWLAWCFDNSVFSYGRFVDNKLAETEVVNKKTGERKSKWTLEQILKGDANQKRHPVSLTDIFLASGGDTMTL